MRLAFPGGGVNFPAVRKLQEIKGAWKVQFDTEWGGPASVVFPALMDWTQHSDEGIGYYSGSATYVKEFAPAGTTVLLDLGTVKNIVSGN